QLDHNPDKSSHQPATSDNTDRPAGVSFPPQGFTPVPPANEQADAPLKHSGPGIASFVLGIVTIILIIVGFVVILAGVVNYMNPEGGLNSSEFMSSMEDLDSMDVAMLSGSFMILGGLALSLIGTILGIISVALKNRRKAFGIVGL